MRHNLVNRLTIVQYALVMKTVAIAMILSGCTYTRPLLNPMQQQYYVSGDQRTSTLLVLLPGLHDDISIFESHGFTNSIRQSGQACDFVSVDAHYGYYNAGVFVERLHDDVILPAKRAGYTNIKIVGVSLGGYGALLYVNRYRTEITTLLLLAPWLGDEELIHSITMAGGLKYWRPGDVVKEKLIQDIWLQRKESLSAADDIFDLYLGYGSTDKFHKAHSLFATTLPDDHVFMISGGHNWSIWAQIWEQIQVANLLCSTAQN